MTRCILHMQYIRLNVTVSTLTTHSLHFLNYMYFFISSANVIYADCSGIFKIIFIRVRFKSYERPSAIFRIIRFREKRDLT